MSGDQELKSGKVPMYVRDCVEGGPLRMAWAPAECPVAGTQPRAQPCPGMVGPWDLFMFWGFTCLLPSAQTLAAGSAVVKVRAKE